MSGAGDRVVRALITEIVEARIPPGAPLPSDAELARRYGVPPAAAAAAMRELVQRGLAEPTRGGGAVVAAEAQWDVLDPGVVEVLLASPRGPAILAEYLEYRRLIEVVAAGLAAEHATAEDLATLADALAEMTAAAQGGAEARFHAADVAFHQALLAAGRNRPLELAAEPLQAALCTARRPLARPELRLERGLPEHQRILAAVAQADPEAAREAMEAHLDSVEAYLREYADLAQTTARPDER